MQIGKNGLTDTVLEAIKTAFKTHKQIRINLLRSFTRDKEELKQVKDKIDKGVKEKHKVFVIGFTIIISKR